MSRLERRLHPEGIEWTLEAWKPRESTLSKDLANADDDHTLDRSYRPAATSFQIPTTSIGLPSMPLIDPVTMPSTIANRSPSSKSSPSLSTAAASSSPPVTVTNLAPVALLDSPVSVAVAHSLPAVYLALLGVRFGALVRDPVSELQASLPVVAAGQLAYAVLCLPVAGSQQAKSTRKARPGEKKKNNEALGPRPVVSAILSLILTAIVTPAVYILLVLFGAPFLDYTQHTLLCAAHLALLALFPIFYARGVDPAALLSIAGAQAPLDETFGGLLGAVLGAWLGAVPIPLDWDRDWQRWPVTIVVGMYAGRTLGAKVGGTLLYSKRFVASKA
ncbi:hypothetical protein NLU13_0024 [Sarocladium strictum]|uniref:Glycosylphosphatidylinositol anchor biosynthesis protein 11 n=1 Tax=Sarocladium strictum TaxID=5046 RepID=A0AA39GNA7_SARSR|nr:hypothetical protein NLU13_0024 [Sarocladium strictum]